jgi:hypothetical protein
MTTLNDPFDALHARKRQRSVLRVSLDQDDARADRGGSDRRKLFLGDVPVRTVHRSHLSEAGIDLRLDADGVVALQ